MQRRLCEMSEAKWSITEAKCLQMSHNKFASQRDAISPLYGNLMLLHSAGMQQPDISIAGMLKRFHFASLHCIFSAYLPTHIKFLTEFHRIVFGTTCLSFQKFSTKFLFSTEKGGRGWSPFWIGIGMLVLLLWCALEHWWATRATRTAWRWTAWTTTASTWRRSAWAWAVATVTPSVLLGGLIAL